MADPKNKLKIQKDLLIDENDLLKDQTSLFNDINKLIEKKNKNYTGLRSSMKGLIEEIQSERELGERINKIASVNKNINKEIKDLTVKQTDAHQKSLFWRRLGGTVAANLYRRQKESFESEIKNLKEIQKITNQIKSETQNVANLQQTLAGFSNTTLLNSIGITGTTSKLQGILQKIINVNGKQGVVLSNTILKTFQAFEAPLLIAIYLSGKIWELFKKLDEEAFKARKEMGMMRDIHQPLRQQAEDLYKQYADLGVTVEHVYKTQKAISLELGSAHASTKAIVEQASLMSAQFGISEDTTVRMLKTLGQMNQTTATAQTQMVGFAGVMANAAGVPLPQVMEDVAKASATTRTMFAKTPLDMIKAAVEARRLGTTLNQMSDSSRKILNFSESMEAEMEASVLTGRSINLQLARQLAYNGKIAESNKEILRIAKQMDFEHMDPFQAEAFARATGKTVDELRSMVQADREINGIKVQANKLANEGNYTLKKQLQMYEDLQKANEAVAKSRGKDYEMMVKQRANQERLTSITNSWNKIIMELGYVFLPIIDSTLAIVANLIPLVGYATKISGIFFGLGQTFTFLNKILSAVGINVSGVIAKVTGWFSTIGNSIKSLAPSWLVSFFSKVAQSISKVFQSIKGLSVVSRFFAFFGKIGKFISPVIGVIGKIAGIAAPFVKWIPVLGWIITGLQLVYGFFKNWSKITDAFGKGFVEGMKAIGDVLYDVLIQPFVDVWNWLKKTFMGQSPSQLGLMIVDGIKAVGSMILDVLIAPYKLAWNLITNIVSNIGPTMLSSVSTVVTSVFDLIVSPYKMAYDWVKNLWNGIGGVITEPLKKSWDWLSGIIGGEKNLQKSIEKPAVNSKISSFDVPVDRPLTDKEIRSYKELDRVPDSNSVKQTLEQTEQKTDSVAVAQVAILNELKAMRQDLLDGKIVVNLDGQLVSTVMNRNNSFRGSYGSMQR